MLQHGLTLTAVSLLAAPLVAQAPAGRSVTLDVGALAGSEVRVDVAPIAARHWTLHVSLARWAERTGPGGGEFLRTATAQAAGLEAVPGNTELALDLAFRFYPSLLESTAPTRRFRTYAALGAGLRQRSAVTFQGGAFTLAPAYETDRAQGVDALGEAGIRFEPALSLVLDIGARARLLGFRDPTGRYDRGDVIPQVVVGLGVGW